MADEKFRALMAVVAQRVRQDPSQAAGAARFAQQVLDRTVGKVARLYLRESPPVTFRVIVNPLVSWMWIGGADRPRRRA